MAGLCAGEPALHPSCTTYDLLLHKSNTYCIDDQCISELKYKKLKEMLKLLESAGLKGAPSPCAYVESTLDMNEHTRSCKRMQEIMCSKWHKWAVWCIGQITWWFSRKSWSYNVPKQVKRGRCTSSANRLSPGVSFKIQNMGATRLGPKQSHNSINSFEFLDPVNHLGLSMILETSSETGFRIVLVAVLMLPALPTWVQMSFHFMCPSFGMLLAHCLQ